MTHAEITGLTKSFGAKISNLDSSGAFAAVCDKITFGVGADGTPFHTALDAWPTEDKLNWAAGNVIFFRQLASRLEMFALAIIKQESANANPTEAAPPAGGEG